LVLLVASFPLVGKPDEIVILRTVTSYNKVKYYQQFGEVFHLLFELTRWKQYLFPIYWEHCTKLYGTNFNRHFKGNKSSEADSFRNIKVKHHTHLKMAMYAETCSVEQRQLNVRPSTIKLHADGILTSKLIEFKLGTKHTKIILYVSILLHCIVQ
jgi:hypothetical protein